MRAFVEQCTSAIDMLSLSSPQIYVAFFTVPNWSTVVAAPIAANGGDTVAIFWIWMLSVLCCFLHFWCFYTICRTSSLHAGISKAVESAIVFICAHFFFCDPWPVRKILLLLRTYNDFPHMELLYETLCFTRIDSCYLFGTNNYTRH